MNPLVSAVSGAVGGLWGLVSGGGGKKEDGRGEGEGGTLNSKGEWICDDLGIREGGLTWGRGLRLEVRGGMEVAYIKLIKYYIRDFLQDRDL